MKLSVYDEPTKEDVCFRLFPKENGFIDLVVVDPSTGKPVCGGIILTINPSGTIFRQIAIDPQIGLQLDSDGRVVLAADRNTPPLSEVITPS